MTTTALQERLATRPITDVGVSERPVALRSPREGVRRILNVTVAVVALVLTVPLTILIAALIKLTSPGPVLYRQQRIGLDRRATNRGGNTRRSLDYGGKPFTIYKFRTMYADRQNRGVQVWARPHDPRVTPVGRFLRKHGLDELPQLWNVVRGDMNIVGPRPEQSEIFTHLREQIDGYWLRQKARPGITGLAQLSLPYDSTLDDVRRKLALDLEYVRRHSLLLDLKVMLHTPFFMLRRRGGW